MAFKILFQPVHETKDHYLIVGPVIYLAHFYFSVKKRMKETSSLGLLFHSIQW